MVNVIEFENINDILYSKFQFFMNLKLNCLYSAIYNLLMQSTLTCVARKCLENFISNYTNFARNVD